MEAKGRLLLSFLEEFGKEGLRCPHRPERGRNWKKMYASKRKRSSKICWSVESRENKLAFRNSLGL